MWALVLLAERFTVQTIDKLKQQRTKNSKETLWLLWPSKVKKKKTKTIIYVLKVYSPVNRTGSPRMRRRKEEEQKKKKNRSRRKTQEEEEENMDF